MTRFHHLLPVAVAIAACNTTPDKELSPCETWKAAVEECATQAGTQLDSGILGDTAMSPEALGATARCSANSADADNLIGQHGASGYFSSLLWALHGRSVMSSSSRSPGILCRLPAWRGSRGL